MVDSLERLRDATARVRSAPHVRQVAITTTPGFASLWLIPRLAKFTSEHPGVVIGRMPLLQDLLHDGRLVAPFQGQTVSQRGYFVATSVRAAGNACAQDFVRWLRAEAAQAQPPFTP